MLDNATNRNLYQLHSIITCIKARIYFTSGVKQLMRLSTTSKSHVPECRRHEYDTSHYEIMYPFSCSSEKNVCMVNFVK